MIRARSKGDHIDVVMLGLSRRNVDVLVAGRPITFDGQDVGMPGVTFMVFFGENERGMLDEFVQRGLISPERGISPEQRDEIYAKADKADAGNE